MSNEATFRQPPSLSPWIWGLICGEVPHLPCGAITLIRIRESHQESWELTVGDLVFCILRNGFPTVFVASGGALTSQADALAGHGQDGALLAVPDHDYRVHARLDDGNGYIYSLGSPTLDGAAFVIDAHEQQHGPALVVLDRFVHARPYQAVGTQSVPAHLRISGEGMHQWRAQDVRQFAVNRPDAPTVVVWHEAEVAADATQAMIDVATVVIEHLRFPVDEDRIAVSARATLDQALPYPTYVPVSWD